MVARNFLQLSTPSSVAHHFFLFTAFFFFLATPVVFLLDAGHLFVAVFFFFFAAPPLRGAGEKPNGPFGMPSGPGCPGGDCMLLPFALLPSFVMLPCGTFLTRALLLLLDRGTLLAPRPLLA